MLPLVEEERWPDEVAVYGLPNTCAGLNFEECVGVELGESRDCEWGGVWT